MFRPGTENRNNVLPGLAQANYNMLIFERDVRKKVLNDKVEDVCLQVRAFRRPNLPNDRRVAEETVHLTVSPLQPDL